MSSSGQTGLSWEAAATAAARVGLRLFSVPFVFFHSQISREFVTDRSRVCFAYCPGEGRKDRSTGRANRSEWKQRFKLGARILTFRGVCKRQRRRKWRITRNLRGEKDKKVATQMTVLRKGREGGRNRGHSFWSVCRSDWHGARKNDATVLSMNALPLAGSAGSPLSSPDVASCAV